MWLYMQVNMQFLVDQASDLLNPGCESFADKKCACRKVRL
jgi:hypothetical protein